MRRSGELFSVDSFIARCHADRVALSAQRESLAILQLLYIFLYLYTLAVSKNTDKWAFFQNRWKIQKIPLIFALYISGQKIRRIQHFFKTLDKYLYLKIEKFKHLFAFFKIVCYNTLPDDFLLFGSGGNTARKTELKGRNNCAKRRLRRAMELRRHRDEKTRIINIILFAVIVPAFC
jgi:hypothetical protein